MSYEQTIKEGARPFLEEGEEILAAVIAQPRGSTQSVAGSGMIGGAQQRKARAGAEEAGVRIERPMAVAITSRRLLTIKIGTPIGLGIGGKVKELLSAVAISDVDSIEVKRLLLGSRITLTVRGSSFKLEAGAMANAKGLVEALDRAKARR